MLIPRDKIGSVGLNCALEDTVVGFIGDHMKPRSRPENAGNAADRLNQLPRLLVLPAKLAMKDGGRLGEDRDRRVKFNFLVESAKVEAASARPPGRAKAEM